MNFINKIFRPIVVTNTLAQTLVPHIISLRRNIVILPLLKSIPLQNKEKLQHTLSMLENYILVIFVSQHAIHSVFNQIKYWPQKVMIGITGNSSRSALYSYGVNSKNFTILVLNKLTK